MAHQRTPRKIAKFHAVPNVTYFGVMRTTITSKLVLLALLGANPVYGHTSQVTPSANDNWTALSPNKMTGRLDGSSQSLSKIVARMGVKRRVISVMINKGECYVIENLKGDVKPEVKATDNPFSLVVHTEMPGKIVVVGADNGSWKFDVTLANGENVTYALTIKALAPPQGSLVPVSAPTAIP